MATRTISVAGGNWNSTSSWLEAAVPTAADDVVATALSGNLTINVAAACRSFNMTDYVGTVTHNASVALSIGDATAGAGDVALKLVAGMTYTLGSATTSSISFVSTSATQQTIATGGKTLGNVTFDGVSGSWIFSDTNMMGAATVCTLTNGSLNTNGQTCTWNNFSSSNSNTRALTLGASTISLARASSTAWSTSTSTGMTFDAGTSVITFTGTGVTFAPGGLTFYSVAMTGSGTVVLSGSGSYTNFTRTATATKTDVLSVTGNQTVTGILTINGNSAVNRLFVISDAHGTARTWTVAGATVTASHINFRDIAFSVPTDLSAIAGGSADGGGNSGITFTPAANLYWSSDTGSWSDSSKWFLASNGGGGAGRVPLLQDTAIFDESSFSTGSQTVTVDMPRIGGLDCAAITNSPTLTVSVAPQFYLGVTLSAAMTWTNPSGSTFNGATSKTLVTAGQTFSTSGGAFTIDITGGSLTLGDNATLTTGTTTVTRGGLITGTRNVTTGLMVISGTGDRTFSATSGTLTLTSTGTVWNAGTTTNLVFSLGSVNIAITDTSASSKTFVGGGLTYNEVTATASGNGAIIIQGSNTFNKLKATGGPKTFTITAGTTQTFKNQAVAGSSGNLVTFQSSVNDSTYTFTQPSGSVICDYLSLRDCIATGGATWYAGANSTNVSGNTGWSFTSYVANAAVNRSLTGVG